MGIIKSFDKIAMTDEMIKSLTNNSTFKKIGDSSIRKLIIFHRYLDYRLAKDFRLTPLPVSQLYDSAYSCISKEFARELARRYLRYPLPYKEEVLKYLGIHADEVIFLKAEEFDIPDFSNCTFLYFGSERYSYVKFYQDVELIQRIELINRVYPTISKKELKSLDRGWGMTNWAVRKDYQIYKNACLYDRELGQRILHQSGRRVRRSWSNTGEGIHCRATINSKAKGEDTIKERSHQSYIKSTRFDEFTSVVFLFSDELSNDGYGTVHDSNITQRNLELINRKLPFDKSPTPDYMYSNFTHTRIVKNTIGMVYFE